MSQVGPIIIVVIKYAAVPALAFLVRMVTGDVRNQDEQDISSFVRSYFQKNTKAV